MSLSKEVKEIIGEGWDNINLKLDKIQPGTLVILTITGTLIITKFGKWLKKSEKPIHKRIGSYFFSLLRKLPAVQKEIQKQLAGTRKELIHSIHKYDKEKNFIKEIPNKTMSYEEILKLASEYEEMSTFDVKGGKVSGTVYTDISDDHLKLITAIFNKYAYSNPLHPDVFPGVRKMEAEVIRMILNLYNGTSECTGSMTSGGTESIILACFAYKKLALSKGIENPVIVCPSTAHAAFDKAADLFGIRIRHVPVDENQKVNIKEYKKAICSNTCMLVGSVPNFPSGTADPIIEIAELGKKYNIPVHVDACLGGMLIPFMEEAGYPIPLFDFRVPGVTSISCDLHKYGYAPKGSSVIMYKTSEYLHKQYFSVTDWSGGIYATPTIAGSRCGSSISVAWATLLFIGKDEYIKRTRKIIDSCKKIVKKVNDLNNGIEIHGNSDVSVVAFKSKKFNIYAVSDELNKKGWNLNCLQNPDAIHFCLTYNQASDDVVNSFVSDLKSAVEEVKSDPEKGNKSKSAAIYGMAAQVPDKSLIDEVTSLYLDACVMIPEKEE
ncbi:Sphingosine-1-phosphate lyase 1 [Strongyloides ratti]|uniref:sphinganine-1-phosphate aldolase n=1 Tax=Strongyloides ratti TaxID=34506 RepID=A0A090L589_STRRB|nr:Sphingosine-1-phosphate lyase 1 [Strongyloides ratti]CEF63252.1 Sphingosine-1-phosphate lyase 1 [Strongyloides ratti]